MAGHCVSIHFHKGVMAQFHGRYLCTTTASQPLYGKLGDIFGRKPCLLFAYCVFGLGALGCGLALDMNQLIIARVSRTV